LHSTAAQHKSENFRRGFARNGVVCRGLSRTLFDLRWYSAFHNVTAIVGAGVLGLPSAMSYLGWPAGIVVLVLSWVISLYTLWQLVKMHEMDGRRFNRYHELGQYAFGTLVVTLACLLLEVID